MEPWQVVGGAGSPVGMVKWQYVKAQGLNGVFVPDILKYHQLIPTKQILHIILWLYVYMRESQSFLCFYFLLLFYFYWKFEKDKNTQEYIVSHFYHPGLTNLQRYPSFFHSHFSSFIFITFFKWFIIHYKELEQCRDIQKGKRKKSKPHTQKTPTINIRWTLVAVYSYACGHVEVLL